MATSNYEGFERGDHDDIPKGQPGESVPKPLDGIRVLRALARRPAAFDVDRNWVHILMPDQDAAAELYEALTGMQHHYREPEE